MSSEVSHPSVPSERIIGYDLARTVALMGMVMISFSELGGEDRWPEWLNTFIDIIMGRAAVAFVILAGVGLSLITKPAYLKKDIAAVAAGRRNLMRRALFLFVVGMLNSLIWPWDILHYYAVYFIIFTVLIRASNRQLLALGSAAIMVFTVFMIWIHFDRGEEWDSILPADLWHIPGTAYHLLFCGLYPVFPWIGYIFLGIWLGRRDLTNRNFRNNVLLAGTGIVVATQLTWWLFFYLYVLGPNPALKLLKLIPWFELDPWQPMPLFFLSGAGSALMAICLVMIFAEKYRSARWLPLFSAVGQSTLTLYVAHIPAGIAMVGIMDFYQWEPSLFPLWGTLTFFMAAAIFCYRWNRRYKKGPLELLMRSFLVPSGKLTVSPRPIDASSVGMA